MRVVENLLSYDGELRPLQPSSAHVWDGKDWVFDIAQQEKQLEQLKSDLCQNIDMSADTARLSIVGGPLRVSEYERAAAEAKAYKDANYQGTAPPTVKSWAEAKGWPDNRAADDIITEADAWNRVLYVIRDIRLKGKEAIRNATNEAAAQYVAETTIHQIRGLY